MLALKITFSVLALGIVSCSETSSPAPVPPEEDTSMKFPPFGTSRPPAPPPQKEETVAPETEAKPAAAPPPECQAEAEPNDAEDKATTFDKCIKGTLTTWNDKDYLKVTAPTGVTEMIVDNRQPDGVINYAVTIPGGATGQANFNMSFKDKPPPTKITPGQTYVFNLGWNNDGNGAVTGNRTYEVRVSFQ